jgi:hypothetical protein
VSNAKDDFPDPDKPVMTTSFSFGISRETFFKLCSLAPFTTILSNNYQLIFNNQILYKI